MMLKGVGVYFFLGILLLSSCSTTEDRVRAWEAWKGRPVSDISRSPYFRGLKVTKIKHEDHLETWIYKDQTPFQTDAYCQSLGGCIGMPIYNCNNAFSIKNDQIVDFEQKGSCPGPKTIRPIDK